MSKSFDTVESLSNVLSAVKQFLDGIGQMLEPGVETVTILIIASVLILFAVKLLTRILGKMLSRVITSVIGFAVTISVGYIVFSNGTVSEIIGAAT